MRNFTISNLVHLSAIGISSLAFAQGLMGQSSVDLDWLAFGDMRGYIEPCGCDPTTDKGGAVRIANFVEEQRSKSPDLLLFNLGNNFAPTGQHKAASGSRDVVDGYIAKAIHKLKPTASLANAIELAGLGHKAAGPGLVNEAGRYVLSNLVSQKKPSRRPGAKPTGLGGGPGLVPDSVQDSVQDSAPIIYHPRAVVFGYVWDESQKDRLRRFDSKLLAEWKKLQGARKGTAGLPRILLFSGPDAHLAKIVAAKFFDEVVSSNSNGMDAPVDATESKHPGKLLRVREPIAVYQVPLGGQGVLRGGKLRKGEEKISLEKTFTKKRCGSLPSLGCPPSDAGGISLGSEELVTWLGPEWDREGPLSKMMGAYRKATAARYQELADARKAALKDSPFAGSSSCNGCHASAWKVWKNSAHAHSLGTLRGKAKHQDPSCVGCHVLGMNEPGGFVSLEDSPEFASVQCENCHGPAKNHAQNPTAKLVRDKPKEACASCHRSPHSPAFDFESYWKKIKH